MNQEIQLGYEDGLAAIEYEKIRVSEGQQNTNPFEETLMRLQKLHEATRTKKHKQETDL